jgi:hypothetical protein
VSDRRRAVLIFFVALFACALVTKSHAVSWNDRSRFATIESLTDRGTFAIDGSPFMAYMEDRYVYRGRTYSDKPPLLAILGAAVASVLRGLGLSFARSQAVVVYVVTLAVIGTWFALGAAYAYALQRELGFDRRIATSVAALTGLGTLAFPFATVYANHVPAGAAALAAFYHARRAHRSPLLDAALAGVFLALAVGCDAGALPFALGVAVLLSARPAALGIAFAGALPFAVLQAAFNHSVSSGFVPPAINAGSWSDPTSPFHNDYTSLGRFSNVLDYVKYACYVLVGDKGLFSYSPLFVVAVAGLVAWFRRGAPAERRMALAVALSCAVYVALIVLYTDDYTSWSYGDRRYAEIAYVLCVPLGAGLVAAGRDARLRMATLVLAAASIALAALGTLEPFTGPEGILGGLHAFHRLLRRAPLQGAVDVGALLAAMAGILRAASRAMRSTPARTGRYAERAGDG